MCGNFYIFRMKLIDEENVYKNSIYLQYKCYNSIHKVLIFIDLMCPCINC